MYFKSLKIINFRKFGTKNNLITFVQSNELSNNSDSINIAESTTLVVGKNNSGKTTITEAIKRICDNGVQIKANDFNFIYLDKLLTEYLDRKFEFFPKLEFEVEIGIDFNSDCDLVTNLAPFINIGNIQNNPDESTININLKYEIQEDNEFKEKFKLIINNCNKNNNKKTLDEYEKKLKLFRKFLDLIDETAYKFNYYDSEGILIKDNKFKLSSLVNIETINANKIIDGKNLSQTFNKIVQFKYKQEKKNGSLPDIDIDIEKINSNITANFSKKQNETVNTALNKIESHERLQVRLSADLTFDKFMENIIKYEYTEGEFHIPENQFGLGYSNLMTIIGKLIEYIEKYPEHDCHSKINLICIEEPEAFMHSQMQELFIKHINDAFSYLLKDRKKDINSQLIIISHSSHILNSKIHTGNSFNNISYITIVDNFSNVVNLNDENIITYKEVSKSKKNNCTNDPVNDLKFLKKHIKYKVSELFFSDAVIFVEGVTEETLLSYFIDQDNELNKFYISIFIINGAHGHVYHQLLKLLKVPALIITDLDIDRSEEEKKNFDQITDLNKKITTNDTIIKYNQEKEKIDNLKSYFFEEENIHIVFQGTAINGFYASSFEEAFILTNYQNEILNSVLEKIKHRIYNNIIGHQKNKENLKKSSYKLQRKLSDDKSNFANELLYKIITSGEELDRPELPSYITDGLDWLKNKVNTQLNGGIQK